MTTQTTTALTIVISTDCPDSAYFRMSDVAPVLADSTLTLTAGRGSRRSTWGAPETTATVVVATPTLVAVHVGFYHKHRGGQGWFYYRPSAGQWGRVTWAALSNDERRQVLAGERKAPGWAKSPGMLRPVRPAALVATA